MSVEGTFADNRQGQASLQSMTANAFTFWHRKVAH
jgi:hypothetical protein